VLLLPKQYKLYQVVKTPTRSTTSMTPIVWIAVGWAISASFLALLLLGSLLHERARSGQEQKEYVLRLLEGAQERNQDQKEHAAMLAKLTLQKED
jgi:hypothetical protein